MKNNSNIYDVDGKLLRSIDDMEKLTLSQAKERSKYYREKLEKLDENDPKAAVYATYIRNLGRYMVSLYAGMSPEEQKALLEEAINNNKSTEDSVKKAMDELKAEINPQEEHSVTQEELLVDETERPDTVMDEYVQFEEVK